MTSGDTRSLSRQDYELFKELDPDVLQEKFLNALIKIQNVQRGSIWIKEGQTYVCVAAVGAESQGVKGVVLEADQPSIVGWVIENGRMTIAQAGSDLRHNREIETHFAVKSSQILCFPLFLHENKVYGAVQVIDTTEDMSRLNLDKDYLTPLQNLVDICSIALSNAMLFDVERKKARQLKSALSRVTKENTMIGQCRAFHQTMSLVKSYAGTEFNVLVTGESGTGKELVAERIHKGSSRADQPFLVQNCSAIPETLLESELFGYEKGAFTGATRTKAGLFEAAHQGIVFLDEIGDMPLSTQAALLRVLQKNEVKPLGSTRVKHVDVRIIAATNQDLPRMIHESRFRQDLYYRLSVLPVHLPPLRERQEDIPLLVNHFLEKETAKTDMAEKQVLPETMQYLVDYAWPGNIRELENLIRYLIVTTKGRSITPGDLPDHIRSMPDQDVLQGNPDDDFMIDLAAMTWPDLESAYVMALLKKYKWNITWAARAADINRSTFASRMRKLNIRRDDGA